MNFLFGARNFWRSAPYMMEEPCVTDRHLEGADAAMERYSNGDDAAFAELYDAIAPRLLGFSAQSHTGRRSLRRT